MKGFQIRFPLPRNNCILKKQILTSQLATPALPKMGGSYFTINNIL